MKIAKRYLAVVLSFALFLALPLASTQEAAAASKGTKIWQPSLAVRCATDEHGKTTTEMYAYAYDKKGLNNVIVDQNGEIDLFAYNKSGYETSRAHFNKDIRVDNQVIFSLKKGLIMALANYGFKDGIASLTDLTKVSYDNGKKTQELFATADGKRSYTATYNNGILAKVTGTEKPDSNKTRQYTAVYDQYGNVTSDTTIEKETVGTMTVETTTRTLYKNTYNSGKLVQSAWSSEWTETWTMPGSKGSTKKITSGLSVYTYKKGKLVKAITATSYPANYGMDGDPSYIQGTTTDYAYTKAGLIKTISSVETRTTPKETKVIGSEVSAYQYKKVKVDKKCVKAVNEEMEEDFSYKSFLPGNVIYYFFDNGQ